MEIAYVAGETPMVSLPTRTRCFTPRDCAASNAEDEQREGPRVMCVGPTDVGKSTVCAILCNYAARAGGAAVRGFRFRTSAVTVPGDVCAAPIDAQIDVEEGIPLEMPLAYFYGDLTVNNPEYYKHIVTRLGTMLDELAARRTKTPERGGMHREHDGLDRWRGLGTVASRARSAENRSCVRHRSGAVIWAAPTKAERHGLSSVSITKVGRRRRAGSRIQTSVSRPNVQGILLRAHGASSRPRRKRRISLKSVCTASVVARERPRRRCPSDRRRQRIPCASPPWFPPRLFYTPSWR